MMNSQRKLVCVCISDTLGMWRDIKIPTADVLIHAGDITRYGGIGELENFNNWLRELPTRLNIIVAGKR